MRPRLTAATAALVMAISGLAALPAPAWAALPPSEWVVGPREKLAIITLDGQPTVGQLTSVLETLETKRARASFFIPGRWIKRHQTRARLVRLAGHALGNRGHGKGSFTALSDDALRASIAKAQKALSSVGVSAPPFLRPPGGTRDTRVLQIAGSMGYRSVRWTHNPGGGKPGRVRIAVLRKLRPGSIISLDIDRVSHRAALPGIIDGLRKRGYGLGTIKRLRTVQPVLWNTTLRAGSSGGYVTYLQKVLKSISYPAGTVNGTFGYATLQAVYAYEKTWGLVRDGVVTPQQMTRIVRDRRPPTPRREYHNFIDIDISRQVLFEVRDDKVVHTLPVSTGSGEYYESDGERRRAVTPRGNFNITRKIKGKRVSDLGTLWWPSYFVGGYAIHGSDSVPTYPASHGCVRIPRYVEKAFWYRNPVGRPVFVHD
ncbi:MAG TPA: polysaccharide deacetylase family protein [Actinomycetota bacterium]|nr:polysaccharide deacetylase family protein [Actinomycetota bacterium]